MKKLLLLLCSFLFLGGSNSAWGQVVTWTMDSEGTYTGGLELSSNTSIVSVTLGGGTWTYNSTWGVEGTPDNEQPTMTDNIPTSGNYIVIRPVVDIAMTLDTRSNANHNFVLIEESAPTTELINVRDRYYKTYDLGTVAAPLQAGKTYYAYSKGGANLGYRAFTVKTVEEYTIHYIDDSATPVTIKSDVIHKDVYGASVSATGDDIGAIIYGGKSYIYNSGNTPIVLGSGTNEITLVYTLGTQYDYTINAVAGGSTINELATGSATPGASYGVKLSKVIYTGGKHYVLSDAGISNFYAEYVMGDADEVREVEYTVDNSIVYYLEGSGIGGSNYNYSNGDLGQIASQNKRCRGESVGALSVGVYEMESVFADRGTYGLALRDKYIAAGTEDANIVCHLTGGNTKVTKRFLVESDLATSCINSADQGADKTALSAQFDYVIIRKLYDVEGEVVGNVDYTTEYLGDTKTFTISQGQTKTLNFINYGQNTQNYFNWVLQIVGTNAGEGDNLTWRADNYVVGDDGSTYTTRDMPGFDWDWGTFRNNLQNTEVTMTITYGVNGILSLVAKDGPAKCYTHTLQYKDGNTFSGDVTLNLSVDHSWIDFLSESTTVPVTIGGEGYSTFGSQYPLDLENLPSGLEAFKATGVNGSNYVVFQGLNTAVAANTGLLLKGTADTEYDIPVAASGETVTGNLLFVNADGTTFTPESGYNYFGLVKDSKKFALFAPGTVAIPANKAYLKIAETSARTVLYIDEDDAPTAINAIEAADVKAAGLKDGKYLINGRIVMVNNGKAFGANGQILK